MTNLLVADVDASMEQACLEHLGRSAVDAYDGLLVEAAIRAGIRQVLTDDGDFCCVPGIRVFTANRNVIEAARDAGKGLWPAEQQHAAQHRLEGSPRDRTLTNRGEVVSKSGL